MGAPAWSGAQELVDRLEAAVAPAVKLADDTFYDWQPLPLLDFYRGMEIVGPGEYRRFLDVGSGIGSKLFLAQSLGWLAHGLERHAPYAEVSRRLFPPLPVEVADAFDFDAYGEYDLIYSYRLCIDPEDQKWLNAHIAERMKPGALFFSAGGPYPNWLEPVGFQVWRV